MPRYSYYRPRKSSSILLPKHGRRDVKAAASKEHEGEEIEVEVGALSPKSCKSDASSKARGDEFPSLMSNSSESLSGDEDIDGALEEEVAEERDDKVAATSTSEEMRDDVSANDSADSALTNNSSRRKAVLSKRRAQAYLMAENVQRVQNRVGKTLLGALSVLSPTASVGKEVPNVDYKDDERFVEAEKDDLANMIEEQFKAHFDILNQNKHSSAVAASFDASEEKKELIPKRECPMSPNSIDIRQTARMLLVLPPSQLRMESELSTKEYENNPEVTVRGNDSGSVSTNKTGDVDCLRQANKDLMQTIKSLMAQNGELSTQVEEVSAANKTLKEINHANEIKVEELLDTVGRITKSHEMEIEAIQMTKAECNELKKTLNEVETKYASEVEDCKATNQQLEHINADYASAIGNLASSLQEATDQNQSLKAQIEEVSVVNERLCDINSVNEKKSSVKKIEEMKKMLTIEKKKARELEKTLEEVTAQMTAMMADQKETYETSIADLKKSHDEAKKSLDKATADIAHKSKLLDDKSAENAVLSEQLQLSKNEIDELMVEVKALHDMSQSDSEGLKVALKELIVSNEGNIKQMAVLEEELKAKNSIISGMTADTRHMSTLLDEKTVEKADLAEQLILAMAKNDKLEADVQALVVSNNEKLASFQADYSKKLDIVTSTLEEIVEQNMALQGRVEEVSSVNCATEEKNTELVKELKLLETLLADEKHSHGNDDEMILAIKVESNELKTIVENLRNKNTEYATEIENLTSSMQEMVKKNEALQAGVEGIIAANDKLKHANSNNETKSTQEVMANQMELEETKKMLEFEKENNVAIIEKSQETLEAVTAEMSAMMSDQAAAYEENIAALGKSLNEVKSSLAEASIDINHKNSLLQTKSAEVFNLTEQLEVHRVKIDELTIEVQALVASKEDITQQKATMQSDMAALLENDFVAKNKMIDQLKTDVDAWEFTCKEKTAEIADLTEQLQLSKNESDGLKKDVKSLLTSNEGFAHQVSVLEDDLAAKELIIDETAMSLEEKSEEIMNLAGQLALSRVMVDGLEAEIHALIALKKDIAQKKSDMEDSSHKIKVDINTWKSECKEKTLEISHLNERLQLSKDKIDGLEELVEFLNTSNKESSQQVIILEENLTAKMSMIDKMSTDIQEISALLEEKSAEIVDLTELLQQTKAESDGLKTEVGALTPRNADNQYQISVLEDDLAAKRNTIDEMTADIRIKSFALEEKITEITYLTEQLELSKDKVEANEQQIRMLEDDLANKTIMIDKMHEDIQQKIILLDSKSTEIVDLTELLQQTKAESDGLKKEVDALIIIDDEKSHQMPLLEQNLAANKIALDKMREEIQHKTALIEEKADEVIDLTEQVKLFKAESYTLKLEVEVLIASKEKISKQMSLMEGDLADKTIAIDEMSEDIQYKNMLLDGKTAEIAHLTEHFETSKNKSDELTSKIEVMISMHKEDVRRISELEDDLLAKTTMMSDDIQKKNISFEEKLLEITDLTEQLKLSNAENDGLKTEVESLIAIKKQKSLEISALEDDFATKKGMIDEMIAYINKCNANCEEMAAETTAQKKKLELSQQECDMLKVTVCDLESLISTKSSEIENLLISVCDVNGENEKLQAQIKQAYASIEVLDLSMKKMLTLEKEEKAAIVRKSEETIEEIKIKLSTVSGQKEALEEEVSNLSKSLVEMSFNSNQAKLSLEDKTAELTDLTEQLQLSISKNEELDLDVKSLVVSNSEKVQAIADLTKTVASQETVIEELSDVKNVNAALNEQVEVLTTESHILKTTIEHLETKSHKDTNGLKELESCLRETVKKNEFLQAQVEEVSATNDQLIKINEANEEKIADSVDAVGRMTKSFMDDLAAKKVMIDELSKMLDKEKEFSVAVVKKLEDTLEVVTTQITDQMSAQKESEVTICNLTKSLEDAQVDNNNKTLELEKKTAENVELSDRLQQSKTKFYELKSDVETLIARNKENLQVISDLEDDVASKKCTIDDLTKAIGKYTGEIEHLKSCLQEAVNTKDELHDMTEQLSSANEKLGKVNIAYEGKNAILLDTIERLEELLNNERSSHNMEKENNVTTVQNLEDTITNVKVQMSEQKRLLEGSLSDAMALLDEKTAENIAVGEKLQLLTAKFDTEVTAKQTMIDEMSIDANKRNSAYEELVATNAALNEQYELSEAECAQLKTTIECLESKINTNANELEKLTSSFQEVVETCDEMAEENNALNEHLCQSKASLQEVLDQNKALLLQVDELGMTKDKLNDEKAYLTEMLEVEKENNATIIQDLKETLKAEKTQMTNQISAQKESLHKSISDLGKSLDEAMGLLDEKIAENLKLAELIENKDKELCENTLEVNNLAEQLKLSKKESSDTIKMLKKEHKSRIFELKAAVQDLVSSTTMKNQHIKAMEEAKAVTKIMIDGLSEDIKNRDARCEDMAKEITLLSERLELAKTECTDLGLKHTSQASEIETLMNSLQEMVDLNCSLQTQVESAYVSIEELHEVSNANEEENKVLSSVVERVSQQLKDEKTRHERELKQLAKKLGSSHGREIEEMKKRLAAEKENNSIVVRHLTETLEDATTQLTLQMSVKQRSLDASIADLARFLDE